MALEGGVALDADLWVLEHLLETDRVEDALIKQFYDWVTLRRKELSKTIQTRLMLRVVRDSCATQNVQDSTLNALHCLATFSKDGPGYFVPYASVDRLTPPEDLMLLVRTEIVLLSLRNALHAHNQGVVVENPLTVLETHFPAGLPNELPAVASRRLELSMGLKSEQQWCALLDNHPTDRVVRALLEFVMQARQALGPTTLHAIQADIGKSLYTPHSHPPYQLDTMYFSYGMKVKKKRQRKDDVPDSEEGEAAASVQELQEHGQALQAQGGPDPLPGALEGEAAPGEAVEQPSPEGWPDETAGTPLVMSMHNPEGDPNKSLSSLAGADGTLQHPGKVLKRNTNGQPRRRNGRWSEEETTMLKTLVRCHGKGKWKKILEEGSDTFVNRSQVDLKDKWRNLERQGEVGAADCGPVSSVLAGMTRSGEMGMPGDGQVGPFTGNFSEALAQQYAQMQGVHPDTLTPEQLQLLTQQISGTMSPDFISNHLTTENWQQLQQSGFDQTSLMQAVQAAQQMAGGDEAAQHAGPQQAQQPHLGSGVIPDQTAVAQAFLYAQQQQAIQTQQQQAQHAQQQAQHAQQQAQHAQQQAQHAQAQHAQQQAQQQAQHAQHVQQQHLGLAGEPVGYTNPLTQPLTQEA